MSGSDTDPAISGIPAALASQGFSLRPETDADAPFLLALYASTREDELAQVAWSAEQKQAFLAMQFDAQRRHYRSAMPDCAFLVLEHRGTPIGRLYIEPRQTQLHVVDIALVPAWRGKGIGTAMLEHLIAIAADGGRGIGIFVEKFNPALGLYRRLGFRAVRDTDVYLEMEYAAPGAG